MNKFGLFQIKLSDNTVSTIVRLNIINNEYWLFQPAKGPCGNWLKLNQSQVIKEIVLN